MKPDYKEFDENLPDYWAMKYYDRFIAISELIPINIENKYMIHPEILDVGCGMGRALSYFKKCGSKVLGVEPSEYANDNSRLAPVERIKGYLLDANINKQFDVIHCEQVLSHTPDAFENLIRMKELLKDDGVLVIDEPNDNNPLQMILQTRLGRYWETLDHVNYWDFEQMEELLNSVGFEVVKKTCTYPMEIFELMGEHYIGDELKGRECHQKRYQFLYSLGHRKRIELLESFAEKGWGRDQVLYCKKGES